MKKLIALLTLLAAVACDNVSVETTVTNDRAEIKNWKQQIDSTMSWQEKAWNEGNLEQFMQPYLKSDELMFIGSRGLNYGWQTTLDNYKRSYPDKEAMGTLEFENVEYKSLNDESALVVGRWTLYRSTDTLSGSYSLNWQLVDGHWKIIADHSS